MFQLPSKHVLTFFCSIPFGSRTRKSKTEDNAVVMESLFHLVFLSCTQHIKNRKNRKLRKSAFKFSIGISALGLSAHICPTCRYVRPCISLNTSNWPLKLCGHILEYIYGWFMENFFFRFFGGYKAGPCLNFVINFAYEYFCFEFFFPKFFCSTLFFRSFTLDAFPFTGTKRTLDVCVLWKIWYAAIGRNWTFLSCDV